MTARTVKLSSLVSEGLLEIGAGRPRSVDPELPILRVADVLDGRIGPLKQSSLPETRQQEMKPKVSHPGDIVLTTKGTVGRVAMIPAQGPRFAYSPQLCYFRPTIDGPLRSRYLYYWFKSSEFWDQARALKSQTDMADFLSLSDIYSLSIRIPPLGQQVGVGGLLGALDDKIAINERIASLYEELLRCKFVELGLADEPDGDLAVPVADLVTFNPKHDRPSADEPIYVDMAALPTATSSILDWTRRVPKSGSRFMNGDTLMARITPCLENGKTGYVDFMDEGEVGLGSTEFIVLRSRPGIPPELSYYLARDGRFREHVIRNMVGSSGRQRVNAADASNYFVNRPNVDAIAAFGAEASAAFAHMKSLTSESRNLASLRDVLLPQLLSGRLRVRDAEKIVEDMT
ncbi:restriction endonuclease subunit S [Nonomuraea wenchangensis]|uniref:restriction endonuclease subunit S n=1 Tax=Nonomuraea wenchangensis TaxID=568860 RepID=UPI0033CDFD99